MEHPMDKSRPVLAAALAVFILLFSIVSFSGAAVSQASTAPGNLQPGDHTLGPFVGQPVYPSVFHGDLRDLPQIQTDALDIVPLRYVPGQEPKGSAPQIAGWVDQVAQTDFGSGQMPSPGASFAGLDYVNFGSGWPPDTTGDVGPNHYLQAVNTSLGIYDKTTGARIVGLTFDAFFTGPAGTPCDNNNQGDPVVLYDPSVDRWVITDFAWNNFNTGPFYECIAVSQSGDPVSGGWYFYALRADTGGFAGYLNDYPKLGVWNDGWYMSANMFQINPPGSGFGVRVWALDRASMVVGGPLNEVHFDTCLGGVCDSLLPANYRGAPPPAGAPSYFLGAVAPDSLVLFEFHVNWSNPGNSTFTGPVSIPVAPFAIAPSVPQPGTTQQLDSLSFRLMMQLQYRNNNGVESLWANHSVASGGVVGVRWYEIRDPGGSPGLVQQGTYQPDDRYRWMGSLAVDKDGNMALGYSLSSPSNFPSIYYAGRLAGEEPGMLPQNEAVLITGGGSQVGINRWGDYSTMTVDPLDDCTFWYTTEYYLSTGSFWQTRIGSFKYPSCGQPNGSLQGTVYNLTTQQPVPGVRVTAAGVSMNLTALTDASGRYSMSLLPGTYNVSAGPLLPGYPVPASVPDVTVGLGITTQDLYLDPVPFLAAAASLVDDNVPGGNNNGFPEPGESGVLLYKGLENRGAITATNVIARLFSMTPGVTLGQDQSNYADIPAGISASNILPYEFSIDSDIACGSDLDFQVVMTDSLAVYSSNFQINASVTLPRADAITNTMESGAAGWTTGGTPSTWAITNMQSHSPTHSWTDSPAGDYPNNASSYLRTPAFSLEGRRNVQVSGWYTYALEAGYDYVYLEYSLDGGATWNTSSPLAAFNGIRTDWENLIVDASVLDGQPNVALRWRLVSDSGVVADGIYIDDVSVSYEPYECTYVPTARLQIAHLAPFASDPGTAVTVTLDSTPVVTGFEFADSTSYLDIPAGVTVTLEVIVSGVTTPAISSEINLVEGLDYSAIATGGANGWPLDLLLLENASTSPPAGSSRLRVGHLAPFADSTSGTLVDVRLQDGTPIITGVAYGNTGSYIDLPAGSYDLKITTPGGGMTLFDPLPVVLNDGDILSAYAVGDLDSQPLGIFAWPSGGIGYLLQQGLVYLPVIPQAYNIP